MNTTEVRYKEKLLSLANVLYIDIATYAIMSTHSHVVLFINEKQDNSLSNWQVIERWHQLFKGNRFSQRFLRDELLSEVEHITAVHY